MSEVATFTNGHDHTSEQANYPQYLFAKNKTQKAMFGYLNWPDVLEYLKDPCELQKEHAPLIAMHDAPGRKTDVIREHNNFNLLCVDVDEGNQKLSELIQELENIGLERDKVEWCIYSTVRHKTEQDENGNALNRWRILIPLARGIPLIAWEELQRYLICTFNGDHCTDSGAQLAYLPNRGKGGYEYEHSAGAWLDPSNQQDMFIDKAMCWNVERKNELNRQRELKKQERERKNQERKEKLAGLVSREGISKFLNTDSLIEAFNQQFTLADVFDHLGFHQIKDKRWLPLKDDPADPNDRENAGIVDMGNGKYFCHHSNDALYQEKGGDAFDVLRIVEHAGNFKETVKAAANDWVTIGEETWNTVQQRHYAEAKATDSASLKLDLIQNRNDGDLSDEEEANQRLSYDDNDPLAWVDKCAISAEDTEELNEQTWIYEDLIIQGHVIVICAPPNAGKTALMLYHLCPIMVNRDYQVLYIYPDAPGDEILNSYKFAQEHGFKILAPAFKKKEAGAARPTIPDIVRMMEGMRDGGADLRKVVMVFDTLKKFTKVLNKGAMAEFMGLARELAARGVTLIFLGHVNKHKTENGEWLFEGTGDVISDPDELIYLDGLRDVKAGTNTITTRPEKYRARSFEPLTFIFNRDREVIESDVVVDVKEQIQSKENQKKYANEIHAIETVMKSGVTKQGDIIEQSHSKHNVSKRQSRKVLDLFAGKLWHVKTGEHNSKHYTLISDLIDM